MAKVEKRNTRSSFVKIGEVEKLTGTFNNGSADDDNNQGDWDRKVPT